MKRFCFSLIMMVLSVVAVAQQDFKCTFSISSNTSDGNTDRTIYQEMQKQVQEFMNGVKWCNYEIGPEERIECTMQIVVTERVSSEQYKGKMNLALRRPIYNTSLYSTLFTFIDQYIEFSFIEGEPLVYNDNVFDSNLTSLVAFYLYTFLGVYFDSFTLMGGTEYYEKAQSVVNAAQSAVEPGWKSFQSRKNRYWIAENFLNSSYSGIRTFLYVYHIKGLDVMTDNIEMGRTFTTQAIEKLREANRQKPGLFALQIILEAKREEFINIYSQANDNDKSKFLQVMKEIDASNISDYERINN
ncbi:MAG: DUF4835 family protein [Bacteroidales bacterium]|jgi:hypothetical protein|nr:DUF4835 family protein [Bacteroidales bacterium]MDD2204916.1 DUF4835 family protein [Bacteroidales bacterium]MDD3914539.1 DUF4835 family protein [Bacteroidales bacterium]MDD4634433.1 DUF4835 family protein [Bacteroidales bacterium]